jgi:hypothetical protein
VRHDPFLTHLITLSSANGRSIVQPLFVENSEKTCLATQLVRLHYLRLACIHMHCESGSIQRTTTSFHVRKQSRLLRSIGTCVVAYLSPVSPWTISACPAQTCTVSAARFRKPSQVERVQAKPHVEEHWNMCGCIPFSFSPWTMSAHPTQMWTVSAAQFREPP